LTGMIAVALCLLILSAAARMAVLTVKEAAEWIRPVAKEEDEGAERRLARARRELRNFMSYDGSEQEEIA